MDGEDLTSAAHLTLWGLSSRSNPSPTLHVAKRKSSLFANLVLKSLQDAAGGILPLITSVSRGLPMLILLLGSHSVPLLRFGAVSPFVVEECARVLYQLRCLVSIWRLNSGGGTWRYTYTHPNADNQQAFVWLEVAWLVGRLIDWHIDKIKTCCVSVLETHCWLR